MSELLARELPPIRTCTRVDQLQMTDFVQEHVVEHQPAHRKCRPFLTGPSTERLGRRASRQQAPNAHSRRQCAQRDLATATCHISEHATASALVVEVDRSEPSPKFVGQMAQNDANIVFVDMMNAIAQRIANGESDVVGHE
jgi:hypothetical protein